MEEIRIEELPGERIIECPDCLCAPSSVALAQIERSDPHCHERTEEMYVLLSGIVNIHVNDRVVRLTQFGSNFTIPAGVVHWAEGEGGKPAVVAVYSTPPWSPHDHHLVPQRGVSCPR